MTAAAIRERGPMAGSALVDMGREIIEAALQGFTPSKVFAMFSGGHDSLCCTHVASQHPDFSGVVHINTGIGIEQTREFVRDTCKRYGWPLTEMHPPKVQYEDLVLQYGFPGPAAHSFMYTYLKERAVRALIRNNKEGFKDRIALVTGVRMEESTRRMGTVEPIQKQDAQVWIAPIFDWTSRDINAYIDANDLPRNDVVAMMHMSGECLCGAFARPEEFEEIRFWFPEVAARIAELEERVKAAGKPRCRWGAGYGKGSGVTSDMPLCASCALAGDPE